MTPTIALLIACTALSAAAVALLVVLMIRRKRDASRERDHAHRIDTAVGRLEERVQGVNVLGASALTRVAESIETLRADVAAVVEITRELAARPPHAFDPVTHERQVLADSWKQFRANEELSGALDGALQDREWALLLDELKGVVPAELAAAFDAATVPCREHRTFLKKLDLIPKVVDGRLPPLDTVAEDVRRSRELTMLLTAEAADRLDFRVRSWVTDTFLPFADLYLLRYQQAQLENGGGELQTGVRLVRQVLRIAGVEPIEVTPGETPFDSGRHIGRSTTSDPRFSDGVITGVVRNGFIEGGQQVIRQPEVIVNRMR